MSLVIYFHPLSGPCRVVAALLNFLKVPYEIKFLNIYRGEARTPEFKQINPLCRVPTLIDKDFILSESNAILKYLCNKQIEQTWYPKDMKKAAIVDEYLDWHQANTRRITFFMLSMMASLFPKGHFVYYDSDEERKGFMFSLKMIEKYWLNNKKFIAGDDISIADLTAYCELIGLKMINFDFSAYPNIKKWMENLDKFPELAQANEGFYKILDDMKKNKSMMPKL